MLRLTKVTVFSPSQTPKNSLGLGNILIGYMEMLRCAQYDKKGETLSGLRIVKP